MHLQRTFLSNRSVCASLIFVLGSILRCGIIGLKDINILEWKVIRSCLNKPHDVLDLMIIQAREIKFLKVLKIKGMD